MTNRAGADAFDRFKRPSSAYVLEVVGIPCLGFALLRLLVMMFDQGAVYHTAFVPFVVGSLGRGVFPLLMLVALAARPLDLNMYRRTFVPTALVVSVCSALYLSGWAAGDPWAALVTRGLALSGLGWLYVCWGETFRHMRMFDVAIATTVSMVVSSVLSYATWLLPKEGGALCAAAIAPVVMLLFLHHVRNDYPRDPYRAVAVGTSDTQMMGEYGRWFLILALFATSMGVVHSVSILNPNDHGSGGLTFAVYTGVSILLAVVLVASVMVRDGIFSLNVCWALFAGLACAILAASVVFEGALQVALSVFAAVRYIALAFLNIKLADIARHARMPFYVVFAVGWGAVHLFMVLGECLTVSFAVYGGIASSATFAVVLIAALVTGSVFVFGGASFRDVRMGSLANAHAADAPAETVADIQYRQCRALSRLRGLTEREAEVVLLIAQGYTQAYCADALMVSLNTVRTHMKRIYAKLDIHTKDELLEMLAQVETDGR